MSYLRKALMLRKESSVRDFTVIESAILGDRLYLCKDESEAREIERAGGVCYLSPEIGVLLTKTEGMTEEELKDYLTKIHATKKIFPGSRVQP